MSNGRKPVVSVIIPAFNGEAYISDAVHSAVAQSFSDKEIIVVDDGSTDRTREVLAPFIERSLIRYHYQENSGHGAARNTGIALARGDYVCFLDQDDLFESECISSKVHLYRKYPDLGFIFSDFMVGVHNVDGGDLDLRKSTLRQYRCVERLPSECVEMIEPDYRIFNSRISRELLLDCFAWIGTVMIATDVARSVGPLSVDLRYSPDHDLLVRIASRYMVGFVEQSTAIYRHHSSNMSRNELPLYDEAIRIRLKFLEAGHFDARFARRLKRNVAEYYHRKGHLLIGTGGHRMSVGEFRDAIRYDPVSFNRYLHFLASVLPAYVYVALKRFKNYLRQT